MKRWLHFILLLLAASAFAHAPEPKSVFPHDENQLVQWYNYPTGTPGTDGDRATEFVYDGLGRLRERREYFWQNIEAPIGDYWLLTNTTRYLYDGGRVIQERNASGAVQVSYTRGNDLSGSLEGAGGIGGLLARTDSSGSTFYHADGGGNITYLVGSSQAEAARYDYDPFGNKIASAGSVANANVYRFSSKEVHTASGMYYYGARFYDPNLQRWLNRDPIGEWGGLNLYGFVGNSPLGYVDPFGDDWYNPFTWSDPSDLQIKPNGDMSLPALPLPDPNTYGGMRGMNTDWMGGMKPGDFIGDNAMQAAKDSAMAMAMLTPLGEEKAAADAGKGLWPWLKSLPSKCKNWWKKPSELPKIFGSRGGTTTAEKVAELKNAMLKGEYRFNAPEGQIGGWVNSKGEYMIGEGHHRMQAAIEAAKQSGNSKYIDQLLQNGVWTRVDEFPTLPTSLPPVR